MKLIKGAIVGCPSPGFRLESPLIQPNKVPEWEPGSEPEKLCVDDMLDVYCGEFGPWQLRHFVLTSLAWALEAFHTMVMIFADQEPAWRCVKGSGSLCDKKVASVCGLEPGSWEWQGGSESSTVAQWGLVCGEKYKVGLVQALFFAGCMIGAGVFGRLSDVDLGRKGFSTGGVGLCSFVLATEPVGPTKRRAAGMTTFCFFPTGIASLAGIAYVFLHGVLFMSPPPSPPSFFSSSSFRSFPSPRNALDDEVNDASNDNCSKEESGPVVDVIRSPITRFRLFVAVTINFTCSGVYYGLSLNVVNLETNLHLSVLLNAVAEMLAFIITAVLLDRFGRKPLAVGSQWISAIFCLTGCVVGNVGIWKVIKLCCGVLGIFGMAATYNLLFIYTAEIFPTVVRNTALGSATQAAQMGAILAPLVVVLGRVLPFLVFGLCGLFGGLLAFYLPETLNKPLYDPMGEGEADWRIT
ncbi:Organic cation/carnitine transporter 4 [Hibiscus syriacus]|uniref:Organic cation/carnitine transporter 4 n=1 Tax=Hibiscus syriacus TaxID=106335 RepID=A0A6A2ZPT7_HIBSY|nr:Organic cation/carnitine transporter 4 [Hibiscus syriacus]